MLPLREWKISSNSEPTVRIGVILEEDADGAVELVLPDPGYFLVTPQGDRIGVTRGDTVRVEKLGDRLIAEWPGGRLDPMPKLRIEPAGAVPIQRSAGMLLRDVVAGRGFHWQKRVDQTLAGSLELIAGSHGIIAVNELPLEDYLLGVITAEMSGACPVEFLKAQCVVARSWLLALTEPKHTDEPFDRCNDDCCQRYQGTGDLSDAAIEAVTGSRGLVLMDPMGKVLDANYAKSCGGVSELAEHVWGHPKPGIDAVVDAPDGDPAHHFMPVTNDNLDEYLDGEWLSRTRAFCSTHVVPVESIRKYLGRVDEVDDYFRWRVTYTRTALEALLRDKLPEAADMDQLLDMQVLARGVSGRASRVRLTWIGRAGERVEHTLESEYRIRQVLHRGFLYSSAFAVRISRSDEGEIDTLELRGAGWGHGAGLCQIGALGMGLTGHDVTQICLHYYPKASLQQVYP
ncbi:MAG: SpoIID/LytB domain-containing protein [Phycisphaeraceae bacterium]